MGGGDINKSGDSREPGLRNIENIMNRPNVRLISAAFRCAYIQGPFYEDFFSGRAIPQRAIITLSDIWTLLEFFYTPLYKGTLDTV